MDAMMQELQEHAVFILFVFLLRCSLQACHPWKVISVMLCGHSRRCTHCWYRCHALRVVHHRCLPCWRCLCKQRAGHQNASEMSHTRHHQAIHIVGPFWFVDICGYWWILNCIIAVFDYGKCEFTDAWLVHSLKRLAFNNLQSHWLPTCTHSLPGGPLLRWSSVPQNLDLPLGISWDY